MTQVSLEMLSRALLDFVCGLRLFWRSGRASAFRPEHSVIELRSIWWHFLRCDAGAVAWRIDGGPERILGPGAALLIPPWRVHTFRPEGQTHILWADFRLLAHGVVDLGELMDLPIELTIETSMTIGARVAALAQAIKRDPPPSPAEFHQVQAGLISTVLSLGVWRASAADRLPAAERLLPVLAAMEADPAQEWNRDRIAALAGLQRTAMTTWFRRATGCAPRQYLDRLRLDLAAELLLTTDHPLAVIAAKIGYSSAFHLSRRFKRSSGLAPSDYRTRFRLPG